MYGAQAKRAPCDKLLKLMLTLFTEEDEEFLELTTRCNVYGRMFMDPQKPYSTFATPLMITKSISIYHCGYSDPK